MPYPPIRTVLAGASLLAAGALPVVAQSAVGLVDPVRGSLDVFPASAWATTPYEQAPPAFPGDDDWTLSGAAIALAVDVPEGLALGACSLDLRWDAPALAFDRFVADAALFGGGPAYVLPSAGQVRVDLARLGDNAVTGAGAALGTLHLTLPAAATAHVWVEAVACRAFDGAGGQTDVPVVPAAPARVGALAADVAARVGASGLDATRGDGRVDFEDLQVLALGFGAAAAADAPLHASYRLKLDLAGLPGRPSGADGRIDFEDLQLFALRFGFVAFTP